MVFTSSNNKILQKKNLTQGQIKYIVLCKGVKKNQGELF